VAVVGGTAGVIAIAVLAVVLALTAGGDDSAARADMEQRWEELDRADRIQLCADWAANEDMTVTVVVEAFEERAERRGEDIAVARETAGEFLRDTCG
jgi:hypothetical protein